MRLCLLSCTGRRPASSGGRARGFVIGGRAPVDLAADERRYAEAIRRMLVRRAARYRP